ncbi:MAG: hypothetical protein V1777_01335 [Candidatus Micrarchaeota archaeon]
MARTPKTAAEKKTPCQWLTPRLLLAGFFAILAFGFVVSGFFWHSAAQTTDFSELQMDYYNQATPQSPVCFGATWNSSNAQTPLNADILVNETKIATAFFSNGKIEHCLAAALLEKKSNAIKMQAGGQTVFFHAGTETKLAAWKVSAVPAEPFGKPALEQPILFALFALSWFGALFYSLYKKGPWEGFAGFALGFLAALIVIPIVFFWLGIPWNALTQWMVWLGFLIAWRHWIKNARPFHWSRSDYYAIALLIGVLVLVVLVQFVLPSHWWEWNVFYERQSQAVFEHQGLVTWDNYSFLGRPQTFAPGFFVLESALASINGTNFFAAFAWASLVAILFFGFGILKLGRRLGFGFFQQACLLGFAWLVFFSFNMTFVSPRHVLALGLMFFCVSELLSERFSVIKAAVLLAVLAFIQIPLFLAAAGLTALFAVAFTGWKKNRKSMAASFALGGIFFAGLFVPLVWNGGIPNQSLSDQWGYAVQGSVYFLAGELTPPVFAVLVFCVIGGLIAFFKMPFRLRILWLGLIALLALHWLISFRVNVLIGIVLGVFVLESLFSASLRPLFSKRFFSAAQVVLVLVLASALFLQLPREPATVFSNQDLSPFIFLKSVSNPGDAVLTEPVLGHATAFFSQRKVVADLYVEFSKEEQLKAVYDFLLNADPNVLSDYNVSSVLVYTNRSSTSVTNIAEFDSDKRFSFLDKVYSSAKYSVFAVPQK